MARALSEPFLLQTATALQTGGKAFDAAWGCVGACVAFGVSPSPFGCAFDLDSVRPQLLQVRKDEKLMVR